MNRLMYPLLILIFCIVTKAALQNYFILEDNKGLSNTSEFTQVNVRSATECVTRCGVNKNCFLATYEISSRTCYIGIKGCSLPNTVSMSGWQTAQKTDECFQKCKNTQLGWDNWQRFCQGDNADPFCGNGVIRIIEALYGTFQCNNPGAHLTNPPSCTANVTEIVEKECNGKTDCLLSVTPGVFGSTTCGGGENFYSKHSCYNDDNTCHSNCMHAVC